MHFLVSSSLPGQVLFHFADERATLGESRSVRELSQDLHPAWQAGPSDCTTAPVLPRGGVDCVLPSDGCHVPEASVAQRVWETAWVQLSPFLQGGLHSGVCVQKHAGNLRGGGRSLRRVGQAS